METCPTTPLVSVRNVRKAFNDKLAVSDVSFDIEAGEVFGLLGPNGAGKTTTIRMILDIFKPDAGTIDVFGGPLTRAGKDRIGYMPEDRRLVPELTVQENIMVPAWACKLSDTDARLAAIYRLMPEVEAFAGRKALQLSGGQQKLVALARALVTGTQLVLLDEPFEGVAPALAGRLVDVLSQLKTQGLSVLLSESDSTHSEDLIDDLYVIERGRVHKSVAVEEPQPQG